MVTDTIGDAISRIKNALVRNRPNVLMPNSKHLIAVLEVLKKHNFVGDIGLEEAEINVQLIGENINRITDIKRISKPGLRVYAPYRELGRVLNGYGISVVSTSKGLMSNKEARKSKSGGEVILEVY